MRKQKLRLKIYKEIEKTKVKISENRERNDYGKLYVFDGK
jgi:hypothetical protein